MKTILHLIVAAVLSCCSFACLADCGDTSMACINRCAVAGFANLTDRSASTRLQACFDQCESSYKQCSASETSATRRAADDDDDELPAGMSAAKAGTGRPSAASDPAAAAAQQIGAACTARCSAQKSECDGGTMSGCYRAAACQCQCFIDYAPTNPSRGSWQQCVQQNTASADSLKSNVPRFDFSTPQPVARVTPPPSAGTPKSTCKERVCASSGK